MQQGAFLPHSSTLEVTLLLFSLCSFGFPPGILVSSNPNVHSYAKLLRCECECNALFHLEYTPIFLFSPASDNVCTWPQSTSQCTNGGCLNMNIRKQHDPGFSTIDHGYKLVSINTPMMQVISLALSVCV